jgi:hypothetical protein
MTDEQVQAFLDSTVLDYKKRVAYGNISLKEQKRIETMFELLYEEFGNKNGDNDENTQTLTQAVSEGNSELKTISNYAAWKHTVEKEEFERKQQMQEQQTKRTIAAGNREKGRMLDTFEADLTDMQIKILVNGCNTVCIFTRDIEVHEIQDIYSFMQSWRAFAGKRKQASVRFF